MVLVWIFHFANLQLWLPPVVWKQPHWDFKLILIKYLYKNTQEKLCKKGNNLTVTIAITIKKKMRFNLWWSAGDCADRVSFSGWFWLTLVALSSTLDMNSNLKIMEKYIHSWNEAIKKKRQKCIKHPTFYVISQYRIKNDSRQTSALKIINRMNDLQYIQENKT